MLDMNGLYRVQFQTPLGQGTGVVVLADGRVRGGDFMLYYTGSYQLDGSEFTATVQTDSHTETASVGSVLGVDKAQLHLKGTVSGSTVQCTGTTPQAAGVAFQAILSRLAD